MITQSGKTFQTEVFCTLQVEGLHCWPDCPLDEVSYLRYTHRHIFYITAYKKVTHDDRNVEFIVLKHDIQSYLTDTFFNRFKRTHEFGSRSCEMIAKMLITKFDLSRCSVSEDNENGGIVSVITNNS